MRGLFITGTDTGVGKTIVAGLLGRYLLNKGYKVITQKWIETRGRGSPSDIDLHLRLMNIQKSGIKYYLPYMSCYTFRFPSSPHLAAILERKKIDSNRIKNSFRFLSKRFHFVIVEGIGGTLVPFGKKGLVIDIAKELSLPILIVTGNRLGAINHTLLTIEAIRKRNMRIIGIVFNNCWRKGNKIILKDNPRIIKILTREEILGILPRLKNEDHLFKAFSPIGKKIFKKLMKNG